MENNVSIPNIPRHVAIIMDGNGRWAKKQGAARIFGHNSAVKAVRETVEGCAELGVKYLTLYAFSTENWSRPQDEVKGLMDLLVKTIVAETQTLMKNDIRLNAIGNTDALPTDCREQLMGAMKKTATNTRMTLNLALSYSGRWELTEAIKKISSEVQSGRLSPELISEEMIGQYLETAGMPDPELLIRTSGEMRISNFLLWQMAYTEIVITDVLWPDFRKKNLLDAFREYNKRERRFGKTSEQIVNTPV